MPLSTSDYKQDDGRDNQSGGNESDTHEKNGIGQDQCENNKWHKAANYFPCGFRGGVVLRPALCLNRFMVAEN